MATSTLLLLAVLASEPSALPSEAETARQLLTLARDVGNDKRSPDDPDIVSAYARVLGLGTARVLRSSELPEFEESELAALRRLIDDDVRQALRRIPSAPGKEKRQAMLALAREVTTRRKAEQLVGLWFGFGDAPPTSVVRLLGDPPPPTTEDETSSAAAAALNAQISVAESAPGPIRLDPEATAITNEVGGAGQGNRLIDAGEWIELTLGVVNASQQPWFSTSAFLEGDSSCLLIDSSGPVRVGEMAPGAKASLTAWVYLPADCQTRSARSLRMRLADTHRGAAGTVITVLLRPVEVAQPRLVNPRFDSDNLGHSDGSQLSELTPGLRFEYSVDSLVSTRVQSVSTSYAIPDELRGLFSTLSYRGGHSLDDGAGTFKAADDLDGTMARDEAYRQVARAARLTKRWIAQGARGRVWLAIDTVLDVPLPKVELPPEPKTPAKPARDACKAPPMATPADPGALPTTDIIVNLVREYLSLETHPTEPRLAGAVEATTGYELVFNAKGFGERLDALRKRPEAPASAPPPFFAAYTFRNWRPLAAVPVQETVAEAPPPPPPPPPAEPPPPPKAEEPRRSWVRIDLGAGFTIYGTRPTQQYPLLWGGATSFALPSFAGRVVVGPHIAGLVGFDFQGAQYVYTPSNTVLSVNELGAVLGPAFRFRFSLFELMPYVVGHLYYRRLSAYPALDYWTLGADVGASFRVKLWQWLGLYVDAQLKLGPGGPIAMGTTRTDVEILDGIGFRALGGLSATF